MTIPARISAALAVVLALAAAAQTFRESSAAEAVLSCRDLLDRILGGIPLRHLQAFNLASRDHIRPRRLFDPAFAIRDLPEAIIALGPEHRHDIQVVLDAVDQDGSISLFLAGRLVQLHTKCQMPVKDTVVLARHLVVSVGLVQVAAVLPGVALQYHLSLDAIIQFLKLAAETKQSLVVRPHSVPDLVVIEIERAVNQVMLAHFRHLSSVFVKNTIGVRAVRDVSRERLLREFRRKPELLTDINMRGHVMSALRHQVDHHHESAIADVRLFVCTFRSNSRVYGYETMSDSLFPLFSTYFPDPFNYIFVSPSDVAAYLLQELPQSALTDPFVLFRLRQIGVAFPVHHYVRCLDLPHGALSKVVPLLDNRSAYHTIQTLLQKRLYGDLEQLAHVPDFVAHLAGHHMQLAQLLTNTIRAGDIDTFRVVTQFATVPACFAHRMQNEQGRNLLHVVAQCGLTELADIVLSHRPDCANHPDSKGAVPLQLVSDKASDLYQTIALYTDMDALSELRK